MHSPPKVMEILLKYKNKNKVTKSKRTTLKSKELKRKKKKPTKTNQENPTGSTQQVGALLKPGFRQIQ